jgi:hypothetical protein
VFHGLFGLWLQFDTIAIANALLGIITTKSRYLLIHDVDDVRDLAMILIVLVSGTMSKSVTVSCHRRSTTVMPTQESESIDSFRH